MNLRKALFVLPNLFTLSSIFCGFYATLVCEAAERSLAQGRRLESGAVHGVDIELDALLREQLGDAAREYTTS